MESKILSSEAALISFLVGGCEELKVWFGLVIGDMVSWIAIESLRKPLTGELCLWEKTNL